VVKPRAIHIELNESGNVHISPTKKNVRALRYLVNRTRKEKTAEAVGGSAGSFDGFEALMESILLGSLVEQHNTDPAKHLSMDSMVCVGLHIQEESNIYVSVVTTLSLLMNPLRAMQHNLGMELYGDVTHKVSHHLVNVAQMAVNDVSGRGHVWGLMLQPHGTESGDYYKQMYLVLLGGMISFLDNFSSCGRNCELCSAVEQVPPPPPPTSPPIVIRAKVCFTRSYELNVVLSTCWTKIEKSSMLKENSLFPGFRGPRQGQMQTMGGII
jgi:hypothetical protein